uniref:ABC transporter related protein n=1 Tax=Mycolicibacterium gilvum (strain PYR-GCK) TaxID=350054 RepID=A4TCW4_MYCGI|nr:ABC transporter related protein [Mycolicibacterium gilvum PYR-GCK]
MTAARLSTAGLCVDLGGRRIVEDVSMDVPAGRVVGIVGPNGCGKSTLLRTLGGILRPASGVVSIDGTDIATLGARQLARTVAAVLQDSAGDFDLRVRDVVLMGRSPYKRMFEGDNASDIRIVGDSLALVDAAHLEDRPFPLLSGGERRRVLVARALAQQPHLLLMDEPTNHLDVRHTFDVLALPATLGVTAVIALHDLNLAAQYCDVIHVLRNGRQVAAGSPADVLTADLLGDVWEVRATVQPHPDTGRPHIYFDPRRRVTEESRSG